MACSMFILLAMAQAMVTAGLMIPPLEDANMKDKLPRVRPNVIAIRRWSAVFVRSEFKETPSTMHA